MSLIAIGDIHGCLETFDRLWEQLDPAPEDRVVFVGDYVDRGPRSRGVIDRMLELKQTHDCVFLRGNHERFMIDYLQNGALNLWNQNGGLSTLRSYGGNHTGAQIPDEHVAFIRDTKLFYETDDFFFVHAGLKPHLSVQQNKERYGEDTFLWERSHMKAHALDWEKTVVCGHTPRPDPVNRDRLIAIDTGCVYHMHPGLGRLTAVHLPEREFVSVKYADG
jgi:serine/threonine protein phosphatase 1